MGDVHSHGPDSGCLRGLGALVGELPRVKLGLLPTPLQACPNLSRKLGGVRVFVKRDDLTGLGLGGNKIRGLEFTVGEALEQGVDTLVTWGIARALANHCRLTAAVAARAGLRCVILLGGSGFDPSMANAFLSRLMGAELRFVPAESRRELIDACEGKMNELQCQGRKPYLLNERSFRGPQAVLGYLVCVLELQDQLRMLGREIDHIYTCSEGATQAGLVLGNKLAHRTCRVVGVAPARQDPERTADIARWAREAAGLLGLEVDVAPEEIESRAEFASVAEPTLTNACGEAIRMAARSEGLVLDPVYTARAMAVLIEDVRRGLIKGGEGVVFVHTGGTPVIFDYRDEVNRLYA